MNIIIDRLNSFYPSLSNSEQKAVDYIKSHPHKIPRMSIHELSKETKVSASTISRFVRNIGYLSFNDFKIEISKSFTEEENELFFEFSDDDTYEDVFKKAFYTNISSLKATIRIISKEELYQSVNILKKAKSCGFFGLGGSSVVALSAYHKFLRTALSPFYTEDFHNQLVYAATMTKKDAAIVISHTGRNKDILRLVKILNERKVPIIAITSFASSPLTRKADVSLISVSEEIDFRPEAITSLVSQISLVEALFMMYGTQVKNESRKKITEIRRVINATRLPN
jgi:DNA-binding MurR/RpiR family transcriptional regulator